MPLFFLAHLGFFELGAGSAVFALLSITAIAIFSGAAMLKTTKTKACQLVISAIGGGFGIVYLTGVPNELANWMMLNPDNMNTLNRAIENNRLLRGAGLALSGSIVQTSIHLASRWFQRYKAQCRYPVFEKAKPGGAA